MIDYEIKKWLPAPEIEATDANTICAERAAANRKTASLLQRQIRLTYGGGDKCLIVVDYGQTRNGKVPFTFQLTDLTLTREKKKKFVKDVEEICHKFV